MLRASLFLAVSSYIAQCAPLENFDGRVDILEKLSIIGWVLSESARSSLLHEILIIRFFQSYQNMQIFVQILNLFCVKDLQRIFHILSVV
jgi:hypothetical protein